MIDDRPGSPIDVLLEMRGITKRFPGVVALEDVNLTVREGEIHAIVGENGAGKSTLMKVLSGVYPCESYEGEVLFGGSPRAFRGIADSEALGIIIIHQELALVPLLSIAENLFLGHEPTKAGVVVDAFEAHRRAQELLAKVGLKETPDTLVDDLGVGKQQLVEIAKALAKRVKLLILDEPTASLNETDSAALLDLLLELKSQGVSCILISHKLNEVARVADAITVLRDGRTMETLECRDDAARAQLSEDRIIRLMVGRELSDRYPGGGREIGETVFEVRDWRVRHPVHREREQIRGVSLSVRRGEIVGLAGLMGAGRTEFAMSVFGRSYGHHVSGQVLMNGREVDVSTVSRAISHGIAYVTEDRKGYGLVLEDDIQRNVSLANLGAVARAGIVSEGQEHRVASEYRRSLRIRCPHVNQPVVQLSGGNQQKVVLAKWLFSQPELLILDEPTRGIDVGAKAEIYALIDDLARQGKGILMISSEMPELLGMCDRIVVMNEGRFVAEFDKAEASQERILGAIVRSGPSAREAVHG